MSDSISKTLLESAQARNALAWKRIDETFRPIIFRWFTQRWKIESEPSRDLVQNVMVRALTGLDRLQRDKPGQTFTGWLWVVARNEAMDYFKRESRQPRARGGIDRRFWLAEIPESPPDEDDEENLLKLNRLMDLVRGHFNESTNQIFERVVIIGEDASAVASDLRMKPSAVREAKRRVLQRLRVEWTEMFGAWPYAREAHGDAV